MALQAVPKILQGDDSTANRNSAALLTFVQQNNQAQFDTTTKFLNDLGMGFRTTSSNVLQAIQTLNTTQLGPISTGASGNVTLLSYALPAGALTQTADSLQALWWGTTANNTNNKTWTFQVVSGSVTTTIATVTQAAQAQPWSGTVHLVLMDPQTVSLFLQYQGLSPVQGSLTSLTVHNVTTNPLTLQLVGSGGAAGDITVQALKVQLHPRATGNQAI